MKMTQIYEIMNSTMQEILGESAIVQEDLTNIVDLGKTVIDTDNLDSYVKKLVNHIGKVVFSNRLYKGGVPSVVMNAWEFGSILEKITADMPEATESDSWKLENGKDYSPDIFYQPTVNAQFFNSRVTFEVPLSFTEMQVKQSLSSVTQLNGFISMLETAVENSITVKTENLIMKTINNMIAETLHDSGITAENATTTSDVKAVNLLYSYNQLNGTSLTAEKAIKDSNFIKYASYTISLYKDRISKISKLFNVGKKARFTPESELHLVLLSDFANASMVYLESDTFNNELVKLPKYESVPYWQGSGTEYEFNEVSKINVKCASGTVVEQTGIIGVMFDTNALGVSNLDKRVTTNYNPKAEFYNNFYKVDAGYYNDLNENFVVFFVA